MHQLNVLIYGPNTFIDTLNELKTFLKFNHCTENFTGYIDIILFHETVLKNKIKKDLINESKSLKICVSNQKNLNFECDANIILPTTLKEINDIIESTAIKNTFSKNSSINVKKYLLNKNEKKLSKESNFILLTEKEIQLIELLLKNSEPISKDDILSSVWNYSSDADTHTVETHIYRLRKKISEKFKDNQFILNNKDGYFL